MINICIKYFIVPVAIRNHKYSECFVTIKIHYRVFFRMACKVSISTLQLPVTHNFCKDHSVLQWQSFFRGYSTAMLIPVGSKSAFKGFNVIRWKLLSRRMWDIFCPYPKKFKVFFFCFFFKMQANFQSVLLDFCNPLQSPEKMKIKNLWHMNLMIIPFCACVNFGTLLLKQHLYTAVWHRWRLSFECFFVCVCFFSLSY